MSLDSDGLETIPLPFTTPNFMTLTQRWKLVRKVPRSVRAEWLAKVPTAPGRYLDNQGVQWRLGRNGRWYDRHEISKHPRNNWLLGPFGFVRIPD
jgi:hypothetical protein